MRASERTSDRFLLTKVVWHGRSSESSIILPASTESLPANHTKVFGVFVFSLLKKKRWGEGGSTFFEMLNGTPPANSTVWS